jgi:TRAP-type transport system periplasmic protein
MTTTTIMALKGAVAALALSVVTSAAGAQELQLRISGENPMSGHDLRMAEFFAQALEEELGDDFSYELFHTQALGNEEVHLQMIRTGQIDVYPLGSDAVSLDPKWAIFDMPFLLSDRDNIARVLGGEIGDEMRQSMRDASGLEVLAFGELGFRQITNNVRPIVTPEDLQGLQIRVPGSAARILSFTSFGAQPISMNMGELYLGLQQGTVDGQENPLAQIKNRSFYEVQNYLSLSNHVYSPITLVMNGRKFDSLSDEHREAVMRAAEAAREYSVEIAIEADSELLDEMRGEIEVNEIDLEAFKAASEPVWTEIGELAGSDFAERVITAVNE